MFEARLRILNPKQVVKFLACLDAVKKLGFTRKWVCLVFVGYFTWVVTSGVLTGCVGGAGPM
jgi:hypothetical protein